MKKEAQVEKFWSWFSDIAASLATDIENPLLLKDLDARVRALDSMLSWEIGPGATEPLQFVISPNLDRSLRPRAKEIISCAPQLRGWEFHSARRPKEWDYTFVMERSKGRMPVHLNASGWSFVLLQYPDGGREVLLHGRNLPPLDDDERWQAAAVVLESILGEELLLEMVDEFDLVDRVEPRFVVKEMPIQRLREAIPVA